MHNLKAILKPALSLFIICLVASAGLALTHYITEDAKIKRENNTANQTMVSIIKADSYKKNTVSYNDKEYIYYTALSKTGNKIGYIFTTSSPGYKGDIPVMVGINADGAIEAVEVLDASSETPGLGQKTAEDSFTGQFYGKSGPFLIVKSNAASNEIQAISGATISSRAVTNAVNTATELYDYIKGGGENE